MPLQVTIPDNDPIVGLLEERAKLRNIKMPKRGSAQPRRHLTTLARELIKERIRDLRDRGDPFAAANTG